MIAGSDLLADTDQYQETCDVVLEMVLFDSPSLSVFRPAIVLVAFVNFLEVIDLVSKSSRGEKKCVGMIRVFLAVDS